VVVRKVLTKEGTTQVLLAKPLVFEVRALSRVTAAKDFGVAASRTARVMRNSL
jgi:hypothetical protein